MEGLLQTFNLFFSTGGRTLAIVHNIHHLEKYFTKVVDGVVCWVHSWSDCTVTCVSGEDPNAERGQTEG